MTTAPFDTAIGAYFNDTLPPALKNAQSMPSNESSDNSSMTIGSFLNKRVFPADRLEASKRKEETGIG